MGVTISDNLQRVLASLGELTKIDVLVGIPSQNTDRKEPGDPVDNAMLGYLHENGSPVRNIPARPFLVPGIKAVQPEIAERLRRAALGGLIGDPAEVRRQMGAAGQVAVSSVKATINAGIEPPLSKATLEARARRGRKGAIKELANRTAGIAPSTQLAKPLIDTGQLRNSITYVLRKK